MSEDLQELSDKLDQVRSKLIEHMGGESVVVNERQIIIAHSPLTPGHWLYERLRFMEECQRLGQTIIHFGGRAHGKTQELRELLDQLNSIPRIYTEELQFAKYQNPGSRRGRNIKPDESRKARYSKPQSPI